MSKSSRKSTKDLLRLSEAAAALGVTTQTLRVWDREGKITTVRSPGRHRLVPQTEVDRLLGASAKHRSVTLTYCRVSTHEQKDNLERQTGRVLDYCASQKWSCEVYKDIGSGLNDRRRCLKKMMARLSDPDVARIVVEYRDRLARYGFEMFCNYCTMLGVDVVVIEESEPKEFEQEFAEDVIALVTSYAARLHGRRGGRKRAKK